MLSRKRTDTTHPANASSLSDCTNYTPTASNFSIFVLLTGKFCRSPSISHHFSLFNSEFYFLMNLSSRLYKFKLGVVQTWCVPVCAHNSANWSSKVWAVFFSETMLRLAGQRCILSGTALKQFHSTNSFALWLTLCHAVLTLPNITALYCDYFIIHYHKLTN